MKSIPWQIFGLLWVSAATLLLPQFVLAAPPSVNGANIPTLSQIIDGSSNVWTLSSGVVYENGKTAGYSAGVIELLYKNGSIYQENTSKNWWSWNGSTWVGALSDPRTVSASNTYIPAVPVLFDSAQNAWALSSGVVYENGKTAGYSASVIELLYKNGLIYQENTSKNWWSWNGSTWVSSLNPSPSPSASPSPTSSPSPKPSPSPSPTLAVGATTVINCPSGFAASGTCGVANSWPGGQPFAIIANGGAYLSGSELILQPTGVVHNPNSFNFQTLVNDQAFTTSFQFVMNGWNIAFVLNNSTNSMYFNGKDFSAGAGCEGGFYQAFQTTPPNNVFALDFESANFLNTSYDFYGTDFGYSNVQIYQQGQDPCLPADGTEPFYYATNKVSTYPVALNSPASTRYAFSGDTYSATIIYTGSNVVLNMYNVTAGGTCTPTTSPTCFTYTWNGVSIPSLVKGTTAWAGFTATTNAPSPTNLILKNWVYTVLSPASTPTFTPTGGAYAGTQTVQISDTSPGAVICYNTTGAPATNGTTGCAIGTLYTGAISVPTGQTIYAVAGGAKYGDSAVGSSAYKIGSTASLPTFYPASGTYQGNQTVVLSAADGSVICYNTTGAPATNGSTGCTTGTLYTGPITVSSKETLFAAAGGTGFANSAVGSSTYIISPYASSYSGKLYAPANSPTFYPLPGTYTGSQSIKLSTTTAGANICYVLSAKTPTLYPEPDSNGGCSVGTLYTGPVTVSSSETLYAAAGTKVGAFINGTGPPSSVVAGSYTIK